MTLRVRLLAGAAILSTLAGGTGAHAGAPPHSYKWDTLNWAWPGVSTLTACFYEGGSFTHEVGEPGTNRTLKVSVGRLSDDYRRHALAAANVWTDTPEIPVGITFERCTGATDIRVFGTHHRVHASGWGGCDARPDSNNVVYTDYVCAPGSGRIILNTWDQPADNETWLHAMLHEFGHVLGLAHPMSNGCNNKCYGPVMSYGSCNTYESCTLAPDENDRAGIRWHYYGNEKPMSSGGGGGCLLLGNIVTVRSPSLDLVLDPPVVLGRTTTPPVVLPPRDVLRPVSDPFGTLADQRASFFHLLAAADIDAYASIVSTVGSGWKRLEAIGEKTGLVFTHPPTDC